MARQVAGSGMAGRKTSRSEAQGAAAQAIGGLDREFTAEHGVNYWTWLRSIFHDYAASKGLGEELVVRAYPFNFMTAVDTKCSAVMLRKDYHKGEHLVEPEIFLEAGVIRDGKGNAFTGASFGHHYLYGADGNRSRFIQGVLRDPGTEQLVEKLRQSRVARPAYFLQADNGSAASRAVQASRPADPRSRPRDYLDTSLLFGARLSEDEIAGDLKDRVLAALDEVMPLFRALSALPEEGPAAGEGPAIEPART